MRGFVVFACLLGDNTLDGRTDVDLYVFAAGSDRDRAASFDTGDRIVFKGLAAGDVTFQEAGCAEVAASVPA